MLISYHLYSFQPQRIFLSDMLYIGSYVSCPLDNFHGLCFYTHTDDCGESNVWKNQHILKRKQKKLTKKLLILYTFQPIKWEKELDLKSFILTKTNSKKKCIIYSLLTINDWLLISNALHFVLQFYFLIQFLHLIIKLLNKFQLCQRDT